MSKPFLKPCPFCGCSAEVHEWGLTKGRSIWCSKCKAVMGDDEHDYRKLYRAWNKRVQIDRGVSHG